jgi:hypothetical protein
MYIVWNQYQRRRLETVCTLYRKEMNGESIVDSVKFVHMYLIYQTMFMQ